MPTFETLSIQDLSNRTASQTPQFASENQSRNRSMMSSPCAKAITLLGLLSVVAVVSVVAVAVPANQQQTQQHQVSAKSSEPAAAHPNTPEGATVQKVKETLNKLVEKEKAELKRQEMLSKEHAKIDHATHAETEHAKHAKTEHATHAKTEHAPHAGADAPVKQSPVDGRKNMSPLQQATRVMQHMPIKQRAATKKSYSGPLHARSSQGSLICETPECSIAAALIGSALNTSVDPCEDFYEFACGGWMGDHPAPPDAGTFDMAVDLINQRLHLIVNSEAKPSDPEPLHMLRRAYHACLDTETMNTVGLQPLWDALQGAGGWPLVDSAWDATLFSSEGAMASIRTLFFAPMLAVDIQSDLFNTSRQILYIGEGSTGISETILANPDQYVDTMAAYKTFITDSAMQLRDFLGSSVTDEQISTSADELIAFETEMAQLMQASGSTGITDAFQLLTVKELQAISDNVTIGGFDYLSLLKQIFSGTSVMVQDDEPLYLDGGSEYIKGMSTMLANTEDRVLANFFGWMWILNSGSETTYAMKNISDIFIEAYNGHPSTQTREQFCYIEANANLAMPMSRAYVDEFFPAGAKAENEQMVTDLRASFDILLDQNDFLTPADTITAKEKLQAIEEFVAYPDWIMDDTQFVAAYEGLLIGSGTQYQNLINIGAYYNYWTLETYRTEPRSRFVMPPTAVNAFYMPSANSITILAGILQNPFYQHNSLAAINYGGIGMVIGHELTHGFDDTGRKFDKDGNLALWWSQESIAAFKERSQCFVDQYDNFHPPEVSDPTVHVNGQFTLGENIADNGGLREAFAAYLKYVARNGEEPKLPGLDEYTPEQLFYLGNANVWCESRTEDSLLTQMVRDVHSPGRFRIIGPCSNDAEFSRVWKCPAESAMNRGADSCILW